MICVSKEQLFSSNNPKVQHITVINTPCSYVPGGFAVVYLVLLGLSVYSKVKPGGMEQQFNQLEKFMRLCYIQSYVVGILGSRSTT